MTSPAPNTLSGNNKIENTDANQQDADHTYEDDFEELDTKISDVKEGVYHKSGSALLHDSDSQQEKGQRESSGQIPMEKDAAEEKTASQRHGRPFKASTLDDLQSDDSEPENEDVLFTNDQQRAMMELVAQKHDSGDYSDSQPDYSVKHRLKELNAELAMEPDPDDRQHRVGFKAELVDMVAPPPDISDDDDTPRKAQPGSNSKQVTDVENGEGSDKKKQYVIEREGKFDIVADHELTAQERAMLNVPNENNSFGADAHNGSQSSSSNGNMMPLPPSQPRPNTASGISIRSVHSSQSSRPRTASSRNIAGSATSLREFHYNSPYAMSASEKERAQERAKLKEQQRKEEEKRQREEDKYRRQESDEAFQAWLRHKMDDDRRKKQDEGENTSKNNHDRIKENEEAFRGWLKQKHMQLKREKLLKRRGEQDTKGGYYIRSREDCDAAYKEWLKRKYAEFRQQREAEKQRIKSFQVMAKRTRKQQMMARAVRQSDAFRHVDYYGYRF